MGGCCEGFINPHGCDTDYNDEDLKEAGVTSNVLDVMDVFDKLGDVNKLSHDRYSIKCLSCGYIIQLKLGSNNVINVMSDCGCGMGDILKHHPCVVLIYLQENMVDITKKDF